MCICNHILGREKICLHLSGCPESHESKEYDKLPWYKKLTTRNPRNNIKYY